MNLLCPNCQKTLTVPEQFAGQLMKCPLCSGTFTVPALPPPSSEPPATPPASEPAPAFTAPPQEPAAPEGEPVPAFASPPASAPASAYSPAPEPAFNVTPPPQAPAPSPAAPASQPTSTAYTPAPPPRARTDNYTATRTVVFNDRVLQWVPPVCTVILLVLIFAASWVGVYPGGVPAVTQNGWQAAWGSYSSDPDLRTHFRIITAKEVADINDKAKKDDVLEISNEPGVSLLTVFYILFFFVTLLFTIVIFAHPYVGAKLPPNVQQSVQQILPWKWTIFAGLHAILLLFLALQMLLSFSLESSIRAWVDNKPTLKQDSELPTKEQKDRQVARGEILEDVQRTWWLYFVFFLQILATASAAFVYWIERRGPAKPLPMIELRW